MKAVKWILAVMLCIAVVFGVVFGPGVYRGAKVAAGISDVWNRQEMSLDLSIDGSRDFRLDWRQTAQGRVFILESGGVKVYFGGGALYLENGKGFDFSDTAEQITALLHSPWKLLPMIRTQGQGEKITATVEGTGLLVEVDGSGFCRAWADLGNRSVELIPQRERTALTVPAPVLAAIATGQVQGNGDMTKALLRLLGAWGDLAGQESLAMELELSADCGPLKLADTLQVYMDRRVGIGCLEKKGRRLYFDENGICTADGRAVIGAEQEVEVAHMLGMAYLLLLNGEFDCQGDVYSLRLDRKGMEDLVHTLFPEVGKMNVALESGSITLTLAEDALAGLEIHCSGSLDLLLTQVEVSLGGAVRMTEGEGFTIPQQVLEGLK